MASGMYTPCTSQASRLSPISGSQARESSHSRYACAAAAVSHPQLRPITSCTMSIRDAELCSPMTFCAKREACSAAVQAPSDWRTGMMSLSMVLGSPTTVSS